MCHTCSSSTCTLPNVLPHRNRQNQISAMLADSQCIEGEVPGYCPPNCAIIVRADPGTCDITPTMHC